MKYLAILAVIAVMLGCATVGTRVSKDNLIRIKEGETTRPQVIEILGAPPNTIITLDGKEIFTYHYSSVKSAPQNFIPIVGLIQSRMDMDTEITQVLFTKDGIVEKVTFIASRSDIKSGLVTE